MKSNAPHALSVAALATAMSLGQAHGQVQPPATALQTVVVTAKRANRVSSGATNLPLEIKDTPQSISTIDKEELTDFGITGSNDALRYGTGINVEQYETNRAEINSRGFQVMLTQIDGLGMTNDWGTIVGQQDTFLFERIELIRGANGLLTGVGNASGTVNYVRKRPTNTGGGQAIVSAGAYGLKRLALDYNKVFTADGSWAGRLVVASEDKDSYIRALHDRRDTIYGVVDGQIGRDGVLTFGLSVADNRQRSPMWGSLTLNYPDGSLADFDVSSSTSQDWTYWNTRSFNGFAEYTHTLSSDWEAKFTYNHRRGTESTKLFYAYSPTTGALNPDNTGLVGWPYRSEGTSSSDIFDANLTGRFEAFGRKHEAVIGVSRSKQTTKTDDYDATAYIAALPAFPYAGDVFGEPDWGTINHGPGGEQQLTRLYGAARLAVTDPLKVILGVNAVRLKRNGASIYGSGTVLDNSTTSKVSPYVGATYDITPDVLGYVSYSDIFQNQDQADINGVFLAPMKGINAEAGVKAEWLHRRLLTTFAVFSARQSGLATYAGINSAGNYYYEPKDVKSRGFEVEVTGRIGSDTRLTAGYTQLRLTGPDGNDIYEWVPRRTLNLRADSRAPMLPKLRLGIAARWQSDVSKIGGALQHAYLLADGFAAYELNDKATLRLNVRNLLDKKYLSTVEYGAIYGAPRNVGVSLEYKL
ncbi:MAG TPA: TonB-dependent siderophore receptor [Ramlibacter sp.]|uniref:TonB-dependent siderophore receptor n=1 Tax=Ramlibacter sp. TaxID=1917967 RepID=UPI002C94D61A|nr:TonB-dependent siderophore receptor [Ramlibacter sp.]HVZ44480.1 TonB-dependent siderophore receptor [Ramlibacter sp.]